MTRMRFDSARVHVLDGFSAEIRDLRTGIQFLHDEAVVTVVGNGLAPE